MASLLSPGYFRTLSDGKTTGGVVFENYGTVMTMEKTIPH
jgi:hypothetical protein